MSYDYDERKWFFERRTDKTIISKRILGMAPGQHLRIATHIVEGEAGLVFGTIKDEVVLRRTPAGRYELKATFLEDDRSISSLTIQKHLSRTGPHDKQHFTLVGPEINTLIGFLAGLETIPLDDASKVHVSDDVVRDLVLNQAQARRIFEKNSDVFLELAQNEEVARDLVALGYRRKQLAHFDRLLNDNAFFSAERQRLGCRPEDVWQRFFEANTWIFGYGLSYQFLSSLNERKLEQIVRGNTLDGAGKRVDGLMKTRGIIGSLCFVEIKRHDTPLLASSRYRPDTWQPSSELTGGVAQMQATVHGAVEQLGSLLTPSSADGDPTGEALFNIEPRSCLVIGSLAEFQSDRGTNLPKFRSFELHRRHTNRPEIVTFDELLERARFIVEHGPEQMDQG